MYTITLGFLLAASLLTLAGCGKGGPFFRFDGPVRVSAEEQTVQYIPRDDVEYDIISVFSNTYNNPEDGRVDEIRTPDSESGRWKGDWFEVWCDDGNLFVCFHENADDLERLIGINLHVPGYNPSRLTIKQMPQGQVLEE